jgi:hypothetical protein
MGLIQSHLIFGSPLWGHTKTTKLEPLRTAQKRAIRKVHNLKFREHTHKHFTNSQILKLDELIYYTNLTYMHSSLHKFAPKHTRKLWVRKPTIPNISLRDRGDQLQSAKTNKQWILDLPNNKQTKIWNSSPVDTLLEPKEFKRELKTYLLIQYTKEES